MPLLQPPPLPLPPPPPPPPRRWHLFDAVVVAGSLGLELTLRGVAQEVASRIAVVSDEARSTGERATQVGSVSAEVAGGIDRLRDVLIRVVRTATKEVNRRQSPRYRVERDCSVSAQGRTLSGLMVDCSEGGFGAKGDFSNLAEGVAVEIAISGVTPHLHAVIRSLCDSRVHAQFDVDEAKSPSWRHDFATLVRGLSPLEQAA